MNERVTSIPQLILQTRGIDISKYEEVFLTKTVHVRMKNTYCDSESAYYAYLEQSHMEGELLLDSLKVSYTEFFRNVLTFSVLEKMILPSLILRMTNSHKNEIRIWTAACASGQETYSLAILLQEALTGHHDKINFRIFATDQSEVQIQEAQTAQYPESALNGLSLKRANKWFTKIGEIYSVKPELKENIDFSVFDLLGDQYSCPPSSIFGDFDLIVCANLLFYYKPEYQNKIIQKTSNCLSTNGYLITGETERDILIHSGFHEVFPQTAIFQV